jgi:hypothetical protein
VFVLVVIILKVTALVGTILVMCGDIHEDAVVFSYSYEEPDSFGK